MSDIQINYLKNKIEIKNITMIRRKGIITNQPVEITPQYMNVLAECILQVLYNLAVQSEVDINYDMYVNDTKFLVQGTDVTIIPPDGEPYRRRIKNDRSIVNNQYKDKK